MDELALLLGASTLRDCSCDAKNALAEKGDEDDEDADDEDDEDAEDEDDKEDDEDDGSDDEANSDLSPTPDDAA